MPLPHFSSITGAVDEELRLRNAYLAAGNRILRNQIKTRRRLLTDAERQTLVEMGHKLGRQALQEIATIAQPETILAWRRKFMDQHGRFRIMPITIAKYQDATQLLERHFRISLCTLDALQLAIALALSHRVTTDYDPFIAELRTDNL